MIGDYMLNDWLINGFDLDSDFKVLKKNLDKAPYCQLLHYIRLHQEHAVPGTFSRDQLELSGIYLDHPSDLIHWQPFEEKRMPSEYRPIDIQVQAQSQLEYMLAGTDMQSGLKPFSKWLKGLGKDEVPMAYGEHSIVDQSSFAQSQDVTPKSSKSKGKKKSKSSKKGKQTAKQKGKKWSKRTKEDMDLDAAVYSETLADILAHQGHYKKAKSMYKALSLKNPEKSAYFARKLKKLKKKG